ncbi:acyl-CoA dehydrogenase family protein [Nocardia fluminea]|uniref:acyl-CoA dehydrogenase family protein n=1 Tax=Nocardia fluminea TaxID=134984 RepID=UPI00343248DB
MQLRMDSERADFARAVRKFAQNRPGYVLKDDRADELAGWNELACQLGAFAARLPEHVGGADGTVFDWCLVASELGRELSAGTFLSTAIATEAILRLGSQQQKATLLPTIAEGGARVTVALSSFQTRPGVPLRLHFDGRVAKVSGTARAVIDPHRADGVIALAQPGDGSAPQVVFIRPDAGTVRIGDAPPLDLTRPCADVSFDAAECQTLAPETGKSTDSTDDVAAVYATALVLLAADLVGVADRSLELATEHSLARHQFGRPVGSFQAIKHRLAEVAIENDLANAAVMYVATAADDLSASELLSAARLAWAQSCEAANRAASSAMQVFGGMGFTWEAPIHHYLRRARTSQAIGERPAYARRQAFAARGGVRE